MTKNVFWFRLGSYAMMVTAALHTIGHFFGRPEPTNETEETLLTLMTTYRIDFGGMERSMMDLMRGYSLTFAAAFLFAGVMNLAVIRSQAANHSLIRTVTLIDVFYAAALLAVSMVYFIYPPMVLVGFVFLCFVISFLVAPRRRAIAV